MVPRGLAAMMDVLHLLRITEFVFVMVPRESNAATKDATIKFKSQEYAKDMQRA